MKKLESKEWIAVIVSVFVVGFFFVFGQSLVSVFNNNKNAKIMEAEKKNGLLLIQKQTRLDIKANLKMFVWLLIT